MRYCSRRNAENLEKFTKSTTINLINEPRPVRRPIS